MKHFLIFVVVVVCAAAPLLAHHSFAAEFDSKKPVELKGTLVELEWVNPHAWIHMEVTDASGKVTKWDCELGSPNLLDAKRVAQGFAQEGRHDRRQRLPG